MYSQKTDHKRFLIHTLGCKVNQYESQAMREILKEAGYEECLSKEAADVYILNTCTVTHHADRESRHWINLFHRTNPNARIVVTGCYTEKDSDELSLLPGVSHIVKNQEKNRIAEILDTLHPIPSTQHLTPRTITGFEGHTKAFVKIQDGCENSCAYCKVPLVRTAMKSKPIKDITREVETLVANGYREIILVGICLGAWSQGNALGLVDVLKAVNDIKGYFRIRLSSIEPKYVTDELIAFIAKEKRMCPHLHIPLQSGDDDILKRMNRPYRTDEYRALVEKARSAIKDVAITTDLMVGFPGETDRCFNNTTDFIRAIMPSRTHIFTFSKRKDTAAYGMADEVDDKTNRSRYHALRTITLLTSCCYRSGFLGKTLEVLVESKRDKNSGMLTGYSDNYIKMLFEGPDDLMKRITPVNVKGLTLMYTLGEHCGK